MSKNYYSKDKCDWRLCVYSTIPFTWLELVGSEELPGTVRHTRKYLEVDGQHIKSGGKKEDLTNPTFDVVSRIDGLRDSANAVSLTKYPSFADGKVEA